MLMIGIVLICAFLLNDILKFFDDRFMRPYLDNPDKEFVTQVYKDRRRISVFQIVGSVLFTVPFIFLQIQKQFFLKYHPGDDQLTYLWKTGLFSSLLFTMGALATALLFRVAFYRR